MRYPTHRILLLAIAGLLLCGVSALFIDQPLSQYFKGADRQDLWLAARSVTNVGLGDHYFIFSIVVFTFSKWICPRYIRWRIFARNLFFSLVGSGLLVHLIKFCVGRQRPHLTADLNPLIFHPFTTDWNYHSFASGHTQVMFTVATMMALSLPRWKWAFFLVASVFGFTRVIIHDHFLSDFIGGAIVGYVGTMTSVYLVEKWQQRPSRQNNAAIS